MLTSVSPKLPMREADRTKDFYLGQLGFSLLADYGDYLILGKDKVEIHFFQHRDLDPMENYGQIYVRTDNIDSLYKTLVDNETSIHPNGDLQRKPWGQKEFSLLDPDNNLLTFGQSI